MNMIEEECNTVNVIEDKIFVGKQLYRMRFDDSFIVSLGSAMGGAGTGVVCISEAIKEPIVISGSTIVFSGGVTNWLTTFKSGIIRGNWDSYDITAGANARNNLIDMIEDIHAYRSRSSAVGNTTWMYNAAYNASNALSVRKIVTAPPFHFIIGVKDHANLLATHGITASFSCTPLEKVDGRSFYI